MSANLENIMKEVGGFGLYQKIILLAICLINVPLGFFIFSPVFTYLTPAHRCFIPGLDEGASTVTSNISVLDDFIPYGNAESGNLELACCSRYVLHGGNENATAQMLQTENCLDGWVYMNTDRKSASMEFDLVCENGWKKPLLTSSLIIGMLLGSPLSGPFADRFGRRITCVSSLILHSLLLGLYTLAHSYIMLVISAIMLGSTRIILYTSSFILAQEFADRDHRAIVSCLLNLTYTTGYMILPGVAYLIKDWRWMIRTLAISCVIFIPYIWLLPESPRWLMSRGRYTDAYKVLEKMARINKKSSKVLDQLRNDGVGLRLGADEEDKPVDPIRRNPEESPRLLFSNAIIRTRLIIVCCVWSFCLLCHYALGFNTSNLGGNPYLNCFIFAALEVPSHLMLTVAIQKIGRRFSVSVFFGLTGVFCALSPAFDAYDAVSVACAMVGKFFATSAMGIIYLYTTELFPTLVRSTGMAIAVACSRISVICAPFVVFAGETAGKSIPFYIIASLGITAAILCLWLPETRQSSLPDTLAEALHLEKYRLFKFSRRGGLRCKGSDETEKPRIAK